MCFIKFFLSRLLVLDKSSFDARIAQNVYALWRFMFNICYLLFVKKKDKTLLADFISLYITYLYSIVSSTLIVFEGCGHQCSFIRIPYANIFVY